MAYGSWDPCHFTQQFPNNNPTSLPNNNPTSLPNNSYHDNRTASGSSRILYQSSRNLSQSSKDISYCSKNRSISNSSTIRDNVSNLAEERRGGGEDQERRVGSLVVEGLYSRGSSLSSRLSPRGLSSARATLGAGSLVRGSKSSISREYTAGMCDEMSCCKSYLGKNNEVKMTSNLPECFFRCFVITTFLAVYMCIGAAVYCAIEKEQEKLHAVNMKAMWADFQRENKIPEGLMLKFLKEHYEACELGDYNQDEGNNVQWDYISSLFFTGTILTTIGYGHSAPSTLGGRVFTIFYAIAGIPFMLGLLNVVAEILLTTLKVIKSKIKKKPCPDVFHREVFISALLWVIVLMIFMTFTFKWQESTWTYEQSIYFSFITMTTIGFGDYVPAQVNVTNNSPTLITREFFNLILIFISVLVWYFLSQVSAQILKVRIKDLHRRIVKTCSFFGSKLKYPDVAVNNQADDSDPELNPTQCTCNCTCGYEPRTDSASGFADTGSERSVIVPDHPHVNIGNLKCIIQDDVDNESISDSSSDTSSDSSQIELHSPDHSDPIIETPSLKIPSIVITPVDPAAKSANGIKSNPAYSALLSSEANEHPYDSGKGSSEITYACHAELNSKNSPSSQSSCSLSTNSSGVFSDSTSKVGVYINGGFVPSSPRMRRSKSEEVGRSSFVCISLEDADDEASSHRLSRSLTDLGIIRPLKTAPVRRVTSVDHRTESFSIHTKLFDDMIAS